MIQVNELRYRNWITSKSYCVPFEIFIGDFEPIFDNPEHYFGIPLTEEWLLKFGFSNIQYNKEIDCNIYSGWDFGSICIQYPRGIEAHIFLGNYPVAIKYVHELQNLYFALTGKELKMK